MTPAHIARERPDKPAVLLGESALSYGQLDAQSLAAARLFALLGLSRGSVVALLMSNDASFFVAAWAAQRSGLYYVPIGARLSPPEIAYILADCEAEVVIVTADLAETANAALAQLAPDAHKPHVFAAGGPTPLFPDFAESAAQADADFEPVEGSDMLYTSGTTGRPKGVKRPIAGDPFGSDASRVTRSRELFGMDSDTVFLSPAPLYHAAPLRFAMSVHRQGGTVVLMRKFDPSEALHLLERRQVTHSQWAPTMFTRLLDLPNTERTARDYSAHRCAIHAGAPCPIPVKHAMIEWWGPILHEYYSGTESIGFTHITSAEWLKRPGSVGRPYGCKAHVVGEAGEALPPGAIGTIYFEGRAPLTYHNAPEKTDAARHPAGWATMGDIGYLDEDGYLFLTDRKAFTIISGGVNIYPKEVEDALLADARVRDAAVFGVPDPDYGEAVHAAIVLANGAAPNAAIAAAIGAKLRERLSSVKAPKRISFHADLPRSEAGKLLKRELRQSILDAGEPGFPAKPERAAP